MTKSQFSFQRTLFYAFLFNTILFFIIASSYFKYIDVSKYLLANVYNVFSAFSHFISLLIPVLLISLLVFQLTKNRLITKIIFILLAVFGLVLLKIDSVVYSQFRYHLSPFVFKLIFGKNAGDIFNFSTANIILVLLGVVALVGLQISFFYLATKMQRKGIVISYKKFIIIFFIPLLFSHFAYAWADASYYRPITQVAHVYPLYHPLTAQSFLRRHHLVDREKLRKNRELYKVTATNLIKYPLSAITAEPLPVKKNILFIGIDSWRYDCMDSIITPNIYKLSKKSYNFKNHYSGSNGTSAGVFSLFYGISGLYWEQFTQLEKSPVFIDELIKQEYNLNIYASASLQNPTFDKNVFSSVPNLRLSSKSMSTYGRDEEITTAWINKSKSQNTGKPFFSFLFYDAAHGFDYPQEYANYFTPAVATVDYLALNDNYDPIPLYNRYKNSLRFIDDQIGEVINQLKNQKLLESTIIIVTGDHGQEFNNNKKGYWQHGGNYSKHQIKVPMLLYDFDKQPKIIDKLTLHYDIVPTLMKNYLGVTTPIYDYSIGNDLFNIKKRDWFVVGYNNNYAIIEQDRITKIYATGLFDITDLELNKMIDAELHYDIIKEALKDVNKFDIKK